MLEGEKEGERKDGRTAISAETNNDDDGSMLCTQQHSELLLRRPLPPRTSSKYCCVRYIYTGKPATSSTTATAMVCT